MNRFHSSALSALALLFTTSLLACDVDATATRSARVGGEASVASESARGDRASESAGGDRAFELAPPRFAVPPAMVPHASDAMRTLEGESCASEGEVTLPLDQTIDIVGSTTGANDNAKTFCADPNETTTAPDRIYQLLVPDDCTLSVTLEASEGFDGAFELQTGCVPSGDQLACVNGLNAPSLLRAVSAGTYYLVVDGMNGTSGDFVVHATCATPACGDGIRNPATEACDGGPGATPGDGCIDAGELDECQIESVSAADSCVDTMPHELAPSTTTMLPTVGAPYNTTGAANDYESSSNLFWPAVDQVFEFVPAAAGTLQIRIGLDDTGSAFCAKDWNSPGCWNHVLYARQGGCDGTDVAMSYPDFVTDDGVNQIAFPVELGVHYFVFVDGFDLTEYDTGPYYLEVSMLAPE